MEILAILGQFFIGLGVLLLGVSAIWFVTIYSEKNDKNYE
jgi:hypothetical protein